jgi:3-oxoacyl-[acyl-carrier protein] reductase
MELGLRNKTAIVTGGGTGIGAGICEALAQEGVNVGINYIVEKEAVEEFASELNGKYGTKCMAVYADVTEGKDLDDMVAKMMAGFGQIDILVNNAGIWPTENAVDMPDENWSRVIDINLNGPYMLCKRVLNQMITKKIQGSIVNITSKSAFQYNTGGHAHYATAKAGINMLVKTLAREVSEYGIRVNGIAPGMVRTPINEDKWGDPELQEYYNKRIPVGRFALPIEIGYSVAFLASDKAFNVNGTILDVSGGMLI